LNDEGMLFDFSFVKKRIKSCVDNLVDHKLLVATQQKGVNYTLAHDRLTLNLECESGLNYQHISPEQAVCFIESTRVTPKSISDKIHKEVLPILPENVTSLEIALRPETIDGEYYHYSHGLKKHLGDCQRIAHGHRSKIEIFVDNQYSQQWTKKIAEVFKDIYLATKEDIKDKETNDKIEYLTFEYHANQGLFQLTIPSSRCYLINTDTTVELIADYLAKYIKEQVGNLKVEVIAYEGVDKGAIAVI